MTNTLTTREAADLKRCEEAIDKSQAAFVAVGEALLEIRDKRLYRAEYATFEAYCQRRWRFTRIYGDRLIEAAEVTRMMPIGIKPENEAQARALAKVPAEKRSEVMSKVKAAGTPTAKAISETYGSTKPNRTAGAPVAASAALARPDSAVGKKEQPEQDRASTGDTGPAESPSAGPLSTAMDEARVAVANLQFLLDTGLDGLKGAGDATAAPALREAAAELNKVARLLTKAADALEAQ